MPQANIDSFLYPVTNYSSPFTRMVPSPARGQGVEVLCYDLTRHTTVHKRSIGIMSPAFPHHIHMSESTFLKHMTIFLSQAKWELYIWWHGCPSRVSDRSVTRTVPGLLCVTGTWYCSCGTNTQRSQLYIGYTFRRNINLIKANAKGTECKKSLPICNSLSNTF